jgi:hypothetical protein
LCVFQHTKHHDPEENKIVSAIDQAGINLDILFFYFLED